MTMIKTHYFVKFIQKLLVGNYQPTTPICGKVFNNEFSRNVNHNLQMLCCKFNVNFQNVKPPYTNAMSPY